MKTMPLKKEHRLLLKEYGLGGIPDGECVCRIYEAGETVTQTGREMAYLSLIVRGRAKACRLSENGKNLTICRFISEGMLGEVELMSDEKTATTTVTAITELECVSVDYKRCYRELKTNIVFSNKLGSILAQRLVRSTDNYVSSALYPGERRLSAYILKNANNGWFSDNLTEVAASIGMSYRHMLRLLNELCKKGVLEKRSGGYAILNEAGLAQYEAGGKLPE